jgi:hypothetical protein
MGASRSKADRLAKSLAPTIVRQWNELQKETQHAETQQDEERIVVRIDSSGVIHLPGRKPVRPQKQVRSLLTQLLREQEAQWWNGYLIFSGWLRRGVEDPPHQFSVVCSRLNELLRKICPGFCVIRAEGTRLSEGAWRLAVPKQLALAGEIVEAKEEIEGALRDIGNTSFDAALNKAEAAVRKDPCSYQAMETFLKALDHTSGKDVSPDALYGIHNRIRLRIARLEEAETLLGTWESPETQVISSEDLLKAREQINSALKDAQFRYRTLQNRLQGLPPPSEGQSTLDLLVDLVKRYRQSKGPVRAKAYDALTSVKAVQEAMGRATWTAMRCLKVRGPQSELVQIGSEDEEPQDDEKDMPFDAEEKKAPATGKRREYERELTHNDVANTVFVEMKKVISKGFEFVQYDSLEESMGALKCILARNSVESLTGMSPQQQQDVRIMGSFVAKHSSEKRDVREWPEHGLLPKGWDKERWMAAAAAASVLRGKVDLSAYYRLYTGRRRRTV